MLRTHPVYMGFQKTLPKAAASLRPAALQVDTLFSRLLSKLWFHNGAFRCTDHAVISRHPWGVDSSLPVQGTAVMIWEGIYNSLILSTGHPTCNSCSLLHTSQWHRHCSNQSHPASEASWAASRISLEEADFHLLGSYRQLSNCLCSTTT